MRGPSSASPQLPPRPDALRPQVIPWLPFIVWAAMGFHAMINANVWAKNVSVKTIEDRLTSYGFPDEPRVRQAVGARAGRAVMDLPVLWDRTRWPLALSTVLSYGGAASVVVAFTIFCLAASYRHHEWLWAILASILYVVCAGIIPATWLRILKITPESIQHWNDKAA